jgi:hypothetical protein
MSWRYLQLAGLVTWKPPIRHKYSSQAPDGGDDSNWLMTGSHRMPAQRQSCARPFASTSLHGGYDAASASSTLTSCESEQGGQAVGSQKGVLPSKASLLFYF